MGKLDALLRPTLKGTLILNFRGILKLRCHEHQTYLIMRIEIENVTYSTYGHWAPTKYKVEFSFEFLWERSIELKM